MKGAAAAASDTVFCGCEWLGIAHAQSSAGPTLPVAVNGKWVKTIDVHAHYLFHEAATLMGDDNAAFRATVKGAPEAFIVIETRLKAMDAMAIEEDHPANGRPPKLCQSRDTGSDVKTGFLAGVGRG